MELDLEQESRRCERFPLKLAVSSVLKLLSAVVKSPPDRGETDISLLLQNTPVRVRSNYMVGWVRSPWRKCLPTCLMDTLPSFSAPPDRYSVLKKGKDIPWNRDTWETSDVNGIKKVSSSVSDTDEVFSIIARNKISRLEIKLVE